MSSCRAFFKVMQNAHGSKVLCKLCPPGTKPKPIEQFPWLDKAKNERRPVCFVCFNSRRRLLHNIPPSKRAQALLRDVPPQMLRKQLPGEDNTERYVITYAQNATPVNQKFLNALLLYCKENHAQLVVIPGSYKNPTSIWSNKMRDDNWWAPELQPYLFNGTAKIGKHLTVYGDTSIQPTAVRPLAGFEIFAGASSAIFGHPKIQLSTIAGAERYYPRILATTGAVTKENYVPAKAGRKARAHHKFGACVVEKDPRLFHLRHIEALKDGSFIDLDREYTDTESHKAPRALALVLGDVHVDKGGKDVIDVTLRRPDSIAALLQPEHIIYHDTLDFDARNHHNIDDFTNRYDRALGPKNDSVADEVRRAIEFVDASPANAKVFVVRSNHDEAFDRWLKAIDFRKDPVNAKFFIDTWAYILKERERTGEWPDAFAASYKIFGAGRAHFLKYDEPLKIGGVYFHFHGHKGLNGARGALLQFAKLGVRTIVGHGHSPAILDGAIEVGCCSLDHDYNHTPSSWMTSHAVQYANGMRTLIHIVEGEFRAKPRKKTARKQPSIPLL